jgi:hypothetical protein
LAAAIQRRLYTTLAKARISVGRRFGVGWVSSETHRETFTNYISQRRWLITVIRSSWYRQLKSAMIHERTDSTPTVILATFSQKNSKDERSQRTPPEEIERSEVGASRNPHDYCSRPAGPLSPRSWGQTLLLNGARNRQFSTANLSSEMHC